MRLSQILPALLAGVIAAQETNGTTSPIFFLSLIPSRCQFGGASLNGDESFEASGSLCAYGREADTVYACVAGDQ